MGGNALKNVKTRRYQRAEYLEAETRVVGHLNNLFKPRAVAPIKSYLSKESFGDLDILILSEDLPSDWHLAVADVLMSKEVVKNGNVVSFEHRELQVDIIATPLADFTTSMNYFAYNDLGNLLGRIANTMGLKLGHDGLSYNWRVETYQFRNVVVSKDWSQILTVLGLDPQGYYDGFNTLESIFKYVASSKFFDPEIYLLQNRNNASRVRDSKRKTYIEFLDWCEKLPPSMDFIDRFRDKKEYLPYLFGALPGFLDTYETVQAEWDRAVKFKARFNGELVKRVTGLSGKELGSLMKTIRMFNPALEGLVQSMDDLALERWITAQHNHHAVHIQRGRQ